MVEERETETTYKTYRIHFERDRNGTTNEGRLYESATNKDAAEAKFFRAVERHDVATKSEFEVTGVEVE